MDEDLLTVLDHIASPIFVLERSDEDEPVYLAINTAIRQNTGFSNEEVRGKTARELYSGRFGEIAYNYHCVTLNEAKTQVYELYAPIQGSTKLIETTLRPQLDTHGKVIRIYGTSIVIHSEHSNREANVNSLTLNKEIEQLISLSAHDLRSPMRNMYNLTEVFLKDFQDLGDGKLEISQMLNQVSESAISMIGTIVEYAQTAHATENVAEFQLEQLTQEILTMLDPGNQHKAKVVDSRLYGDKTAVQMVLRNLIDNAIKHNQDSKLTLHVYASQTDDNTIEVSLKDNGKGLDNPEELFDPQEPAKIDSGFGLRAVTRLLKARGGHVAANSRMDIQGLEVKFSLPGRIIQPRNLS